MTFKNYGTICEKAVGVSWSMEPLGKFLRVVNGVPRKNIDGPLKDFPRAKPEGIFKGRPLIFS